MGTRGGMAKNPFGGRTRLDRLDLMECLEKHAPPEKVMFLQTITDAVHNYLFAFLGRNGTSPEEFAYAYEYLFHVRSKDKSTWGARRVRVTDGSEKPQTIELTDAQMRDMCFDTHYEFSGLSSLMPLDRFVRELVNIRREIVEENRGQIFSYLDDLYRGACTEAVPGHQLPLCLIDRVETLVKPNFAELAALLYLPKKYMAQPIPQKVRRCRTSKGVAHAVPAMPCRIYSRYRASN